MAFTYGFFNSVSNDRVYNADQMSNIFQGLLSDGVFQNVGNKLAVQPNSGMTIQVATGRGWFARKWVNNDSPYQITLSSSDVTLNKYAAICIKVDTTNAVRSAALTVKYSELATTPVKPTMTRSETINEYCLAYVYIGHGVTAITAADIEDTRQNTSLCGWVTGLITQITPETLYTQFTAIFNTWFEHLVDIIDEEVETTLVNAMSRNITITLDKDDWADNQQTVAVVGMSATKNVTSFINDDGHGISCTAQGTNYLTFSCDTVPTADITANVMYSAT